MTILQPVQAECSNNYRSYISSIRITNISGTDFFWNFIEINTTLKCWEMIILFSSIFSSIWVKKCMFSSSNLIHDDGFHFSIKKEDNVNEHGGYITRDCPDQDAIHEGKKLVNPLDHPTRIMIMGDNFMVHTNHLLLVSRFDRLRHGLSKNHLERTDRQNWKVAQELTFLSVQQCLWEIINGNEHNAPDESLKGTYYIPKISLRVT